MKRRWKWLVVVAVTITALAGLWMWKKIEAGASTSVPASRFMNLKAGTSVEELSRSLPEPSAVWGPDVLADHSLESQCEGAAKAWVYYREGGDSHILYFGRDGRLKCIDETSLYVSH